MGPPEGMYETFSGPFEGRAIRTMSADTILLRRPEEMKREPSECDHRDVETLGFNRNAKFLRCLSCGSVLVVQRSRVWVIAPSARSV